MRSYGRLTWLSAETTPIRMKDRALAYVFMDILRVMFRGLEFGQLQSSNQNNDIHFNLILNNSKISKIVNQLYFNEKFKNLNELVN